ncbi:MAG: tetratricopeptide repeat protein [bacterium]|nr:tetratricopeptide repeat protein [bacterium]
MLIAIHLLIAAHIAQWWLTGETMSPLEPSEAMEAGKRGLVNAGLVFFAAMILLTALFGRFFCGWACHLVALQDLCRWLLARVGIRPRPLRSRLLLWVPMVAFVYMFLWPAIYRLWYGDRLAVEHVELTTSDFWATFPGWGVAALTFFVCGFAIVYFLGAKGFCTYACPYGAIFVAVDRLAPGRIRVTDACEGCGHCTAVCSSNVRVHEEVRTWGMITDPGCMKCMDCVSVCPNDALYFGFGAPGIAASTRPGATKPRHRREHTWWEELLLAAFFVLAFVTFRGLYGVVPFLLALGLAAILSYLALLLLRFVYKPNLTLRRMALKRAGKLRPAGFAYLGVMTLVLGLWVHSAGVQAEAFGERRRAATGVEYLRQGIAHVESGDLRAAGAAFERGLAEGTRSPDLLYNAGLVDAMSGEAERAIARFEEALAADPSYLQARENLAGMLCSVGRFREGLEHYRAAVELSPGDATTHFFVARAHLALGEPEPAAEQLRRAVELDPELAEARGLLEQLRQSGY